MTKISWICAFVVAVKLSTCTEEGNNTTNVNIYTPPLLFCTEKTLKSALAPLQRLPDEITNAWDDNDKQKNLLRELQDRWHILMWYRIQSSELDKLSKVWSTLKTDSDLEMKRSQYTRIRVWIDTLEEIFFPMWLIKAKNFTRYEKWLIGYSVCKENHWEIFKQANNDKYGNNTKEGTIALAKAISDLHSEVSTELPNYNTMSLRVPETDREIDNLCSVVGERTTMKHYACKSVSKAQSLLGISLLTKELTGTKPYSILYGIIRSKNIIETFKVITEHFTNKKLSATMTGVENCIVKVDQFSENTNLVTFFATCPDTVGREELNEKLSPLIKTYVCNLESDLQIFKSVFC